MPRDLFDQLQVPETEGIKYAGSKLKILPYILHTIAELPDVHNVLDGFSGTTRVAQALYQSGYGVTANDTAVWSEVFGRCFLQADRTERYYREMIDHLNALEGRDGWFSEHYGGTETRVEKHPFQLKNTRKLDAIREEIDRMGVNPTDKCVLLTSLILALDAVDNTLGHYVSYLSEWSPRSYNDLKLKLPRLLYREGERADVFRRDIFDTINSPALTDDLAYFDPPYGSNNEKMPPSRVRYASYYHIWTTVICNDRPALFGKALRREDTRDRVAASVFEEFRTDESGKHIAMKALDRLIRETPTHYILLSYSSGGRVTKQELIDILNVQGRLRKIIEIDYRKNVMAAMKWTNEWAAREEKNSEYLFLMEK